MNLLDPNSDSPHCDACVPTELDIHRLIDTGSIISVFQPQVSIKRGAVFGLEALSRGKVPGTQVSIPPQTLFSLAAAEGRLLDLDRVCRQKALDAFASLHAGNKGLLLSINIDASVIDSTSVGSQVLLKQVRHSGISPNNVIIEIIESRSRDTGALIEFVAYYRRHGFLIALDDVGAGHSNLDRVPLLKPDILKVDRALISGVDEQFYKFEVAKSMVKMGERLGALVLAEGVERQEEVLTMLSVGVDVYQGFYFGRPGPLEQDLSYPAERVETVAESFRAHVMERIAVEKALFKSYDELVDEICSGLADDPGLHLDSKLTEYIDAHAAIECLYVLDMAGRQVTGTICNPDRLKMSKRLIYEPAKLGADHSLKEYYLPIRAGLPKFTTEPYISLASGNRCITIAQTFQDGCGRELILCMDVGQA